MVVFKLIINLHFPDMFIDYVLLMFEIIEVDNLKTSIKTIIIDYL